MNNIQFNSLTEVIKRKLSLKANSLRRFLIFLFTGLSLAVFVFPEDVFGRRGGFRGGSFRSSRGSSWGSKSSRSSAWGSKRSSRKLSGRKSTTAKRSKLSKADRTRYEKAATQGTVFRSRSDAQKSFAGKHGSKYKSTYAQKPAKRPDHIPRTTTVDGRKHDVNYNPAYGGYGYFGPGGGWIMYSVVRDVAMMNLLMNRHNYYYGDRPGEHRAGIGSSFWSGLFVFALVFMLATSFRRF